MNLGFGSGKTDHLGLKVNNRVSLTGTFGVITLVNSSNTQIFHQPFDDKHVYVLRKTAIGTIPELSCAK